MLYPASISLLSWGLRDGTVVGGQRRGTFGKFSHLGRVTGKSFITEDLYAKLALPTYLGTW